MANTRYMLGYVSPRRGHKRTINFLFFVYITPIFESFLEDGLPEMLSELGVLAERGIKKSKTSSDSSDFKQVNFAVFFYMCCRKYTVLQCFECIFAQQLLWRPSEAVDVWVSSGGALGGPGRALGGSIYRKTPDQPHQRPLC